MGSGGGLCRPEGDDLIEAERWLGPNLNHELGRDRDARPSGVYVPLRLRL